MVLDIIIPEMNSKPGTKDAVISILTTEWPLTLRGIFYKIKKQYDYSYSYQAVFKAVKELVHVEVLIEKEKKYEINIGWVKKVQSFTDVVETSYYAKERVKSVSGIHDSKKANDIIVLNFESIFDAEKYLYYFMKSDLLKIRNDIICWKVNLEWRPIFYLRSEYNYYKRLMAKGHKFYFLCSGKSETEKLCKTFYQSIGVKFKLINEKFSNDSLVFGDYFISIYIPEELKKKMEQMLEKRDIMKLIKEVMEFKSSIKVIITKDASLASEIKKQTVKKFA